MRLTEVDDDDDDDNDDGIDGLGGQIDSVFDDGQLVEEESLKSNRLIEPPGDDGGLSVDAPDDDDNSDNGKG